MFYYNTFKILSPLICIDWMFSIQTVTSSDDDIVIYTYWIVIGLAFPVYTYIDSSDRKQDSYLLSWQLQSDWCSMSFFTVLKSQILSLPNMIFCSIASAGIYFRKCESSLLISSLQCWGSYFETVVCQAHNLWSIFS